MLLVHKLYIVVHVTNVYIYIENKTKSITISNVLRGQHMTKSTTIRVSEETKIALKKLGTMDDSYNTVISRLIEEHYKNNKKQASI